MSAYSPARIYRVTSDDAAASSGLTFAILIHKVVVIGGTDNTASIKLYNAATVTGNSIIEVRAASALMAESNFDPPVPAGQLSADITGSGGLAFVYYSRP
jgi:hypothetical protein